jgi:hypothetical protein
MINNILEKEDIFFNFKRDGFGNGYAFVFVIGNEVVHGGIFTISFSKNILFNKCEFSSEINMVGDSEKEIIIAKTLDKTYKFIVDEKLTAVLLSDPKIINLKFPENRLVMPGWNFDGKIFYTTESIDGVEKRIDGQGEVIND